ncbi:hypothetical protein ACFL2C_04445 [Patescibacteria group bacterium]
MTHVSQKKLDKKFDKLLSRVLVGVFTGNSGDSTSSILQSLLTKTEIQMFKKRIAIFMLRDAGFTLREISYLSKTTTQTAQRQLLTTKTTSTQSRLLRKKLKKLYTKHNIVDFIKSADRSFAPSSLRRKISSYSK